MGPQAVAGRPEANGSNLGHAICQTPMRMHLEPEDM